MKIKLFNTYKDTDDKSMVIPYRIDDALINYFIEVENSWETDYDNFERPNEYWKKIKIKVPNKSKLISLIFTDKEIRLM